MEEIDAPPQELWFMLDLFLDLHLSRIGPEFSFPITFRDIWCYARLMQLDLAPWQVRCLRDMDSAMIEGGRADSGGSS